jgi:hypothetical protein
MEILKLILVMFVAILVNVVSEEQLINVVLVTRDFIYMKINVLLNVQLDITQIQMEPVKDVVVIVQLVTDLLQMSAQVVIHANIIIRVNVIILAQMELIK